ncbi:MAG: O-antigen ligase family protein [Rickettsia endosymbiont of Bryobia graminum]|nr:O-antigen ligase family protein [Rickettsia endosymbiont of Bryobia graminum]
MILNFIYTLIVLIPTLGLLSGFSIAITIPVFLLLILIALRNKIPINYSNIQKNLLANWKLEILFALWCFITISYSLNYLSSLFVYSLIGIVTLIGFIVHSNIDKLSINIEKSRAYFLVGMLFAICIFFIEYWSHGIISRTFRNIFQPNSTQFALYTIDRGCALISIFSWIVIAILLQQRKYLLTIIYLILITYLLFISDSLASFLAFILGGLVFLTSRLFMTKTLQSLFLKLFTIAILSSSILTPIILYQIDPHEASYHYAKSIPPSAKHRLYIWHSIAKQITEKPIFGRGFYSSKAFSIEWNKDPSTAVSYNNVSWSTFPLHPHNNIMQILFETGVIGFILFLSLVYKYLKQIGNIGLADASISSSILNYRSVGYACFINYYIIAMISWNIWQTWWFCTIFGVIALFKLLLSNNKTLP